jgi:UDP-glucose:(heptosyl)LPS alpha-1,3-glucosyltransferase
MSSRAHRLAIVCRDLRGLGGTTRTVVEHARALTARGWSVDVLAYRFDRRRLESAGARVRRVPGLPWTSWKRPLFAAAADLMARGYDAVHGHGDNLAQDVLSLHNCVHAAHEAIHGGPLPDSDVVGRLHARQLRERRFKLLICNSRLMAEDVARRFGVPAEKTRVVHPGHDPRQFNARRKEEARSAARRELGLSEGDVVIGLVTSGDFVKRGVGRFLEILADLKRRRLPFKALIVGKETRLDAYRRRAAELEVADRVIFGAPRRDVEVYYHALDVYCHPAFYEEFGQSVQEALACGVPVVCGDKVGAAELLPASMRGFVADPRGDKFADGLAALAADADLRRSLAAEAPGSVAPNTWDANAAKTASALAAAVSKR